MISSENLIGWIHDQLLKENQPSRCREIGCSHYSVITTSHPYGEGSTTEELWDCLAEGDGDQKCPRAQTIIWCAAERVINIGKTHHEISRADCRVSGG